MDGNVYEQMHDGDKELWEHPEEDPEWKKGGRCRTNMCADGCYADDSHNFEDQKNISRVRKLTKILHMVQRGAVSILETVTHS